MIAYLFETLFLIVPLTFFPKTSELFEFNKILLLYFFTILIASSWAIKSIKHKKFIFKKTLLDAPLLIFLISQTVSTLLSIDQRTSIFGYYGRWNGGLISIICYALLYWAFVSNMGRRETRNVIRHTLISGTIISIWGVLEHFGKSPSCLLLRGEFSTDCFVQDVKTRVFATFGQPNWLAAFIVAITPLTWIGGVTNYQLSNSKQIQNSKFKIQNTVIWYALSLIFFATILFTKSRSGFVGIIVAFVIFWGINLITYKKKVINKFLLTTNYWLLATIIIGSPFQPLVINHQPSAIESGGTESSTIRKIIWQGAIDAWKAYPLFGSGVETFAYIYPQFRPLEHNLTSEWNFIYNKAHNEYLNYLSTTGLFGLLAYLLVVVTSMSQIFNVKFLISKKAPKLKFQLGQLEQLDLSVGKTEMRSINIALLAGYISLLITNFFGFSVVTTNFLLFLFPAMAFSLQKLQSPNVKSRTNSKFQILIILLITGYCFLATFQYWYADYLFAEAQRQKQKGALTFAALSIIKAQNLANLEPIYKIEAAQIYRELALLYDQENDLSLAKKYTLLSVNEVISALALNPRNTKLIKQSAKIYSDLSTIDSSYQSEERSLLEKLKRLSPTDPSIFFNMGVNYLKDGARELAITELETAIQLKADFPDAKALLEYARKQ